MIKTGRHTATLDGEFVVFLIGMRFNALWRVDKWLPVLRAMPRMLSELEARPELGFLHGGAWLGRTAILVQYWRSFDQLLAYASATDAGHLPAWKAFNRAVRNGDVGIWHETYVVGPGRYENIYANMPPFGLGAAGRLEPATGPNARAADRLATSGLTLQA